MSRLRDTLAVPESMLVFNNGSAMLPDHLLRDTPITDSVWVSVERHTNDPNRKENEENGELARGERDVDFDTNLDNCCIM